VAVTISVVPKNIYCKPDIFSTSASLQK